MKSILFGATALSCALLAPVTAFGGTPIWLDKSQTPDARAEAAVQAMSLSEKLQLVFGYFSTRRDSMTRDTRNFIYPVDGRPASAGYIAGIPRLGIPAQWETDAGTGVASQRTEAPRLRTALPAGQAIAATWNPEIAYAGGAMIGNEARLSGFNVHLAGGMNLAREPRNGRNFEYAGEDPLLSGVITGQSIRGIQSNHIVATMKHFAFNNQETSRKFIDVKIADQAARQSDLLAFQLAYEIGEPGSVMCGYNRVNGDYACENAWLLNDVLKTDWGFKGYVMSDWGATHSTVAAAMSGLDQQSGWAFDASPYFDAALREAVNNRHVPLARLDDMAKRIVWALYKTGAADAPVDDQSGTIDFASHALVTRAAAEESLVLLKNDGLLPLSRSVRTIAVIGGHADFGVLSGGGSSQVYTEGNHHFDGEGPEKFPGPLIYYASSPFKALSSRSSARITYVDGSDTTTAASAAAQADLVIVFATQWMAEDVDALSLDLPNHQDDLIRAVTAANRKTIVVLETGGPVTMPWLSQVGAVVEAWYPGSAGGEAIARVLTGEVNPSGRLPVTFPASLSQLPRPRIDGIPHPDEDAHLHTDYDIEGAAVGYKWFDRSQAKPLFPFGFGLSYTTFSSADLKASPSESQVKVSLTVRNTGQTRGATVAQIYVSPEKDAGWEAPKRLAAFSKVDLKPGESRKIDCTIDARLLAVFDSDRKTWVIRPGNYRIMTGNSADDITASVIVHLEEAKLDVRGHALAAAP